MNTQSYVYFDETYFQDGSKKGTAYINYKESARDSPTFREIALAVRDVFHPQRVLDVGCATGTIVRHLNEAGCEAHGIDVSEWAVKNAEHPNVRLASADNLPYPDKFFDVVISCHSMEHLPDSVFERSIKEIARVGSAFFFHMLPLVGTPPYTGDPEAVRRELRKDPTHQQLHSKEWWVQRFEALGCTEVNTCILFKNETPNAELSTGQFMLKKHAFVPDAEISNRARRRNQRIFREVQLARMEQAQSTTAAGPAAHLSYTDRIWKDVEKKFSEDETLNLMGRTLKLVVIVEGKACQLRLAAGRDSSTQQYADAGEFHLLAKPGCNVYTLSTEQFATLRGRPDYSAVNHLALGGENEKSELLIYLSDDTGFPILA